MKLLQLCNSEETIKKKPLCHIHISQKAFNNFGETAPRILCSRFSSSTK